MTLDLVTRAYCLDPKQPWALAHGLLVYGPELKLPDGSVATERLVADNLPAGELRFPSNRGQTPVDAHPGLILKTLLELKIPDEQSFKRSDGSSVTLGALRDAFAQSWNPTLSGADALKNEAWGLEVLATSPRATPELRSKALEVLASNQAYFEAWAPGAKPKPYRKASIRGPGGKRLPAAIHRYYCGGLHLFQAVQRLHGGTAPPRLARQYELLLLRLRLETTYWKTVQKQVEARPGPNLAAQKQVFLAQRLKLQGHALETYLRAVAVGAAPLGESERAALKAGFGELQLTVQALVQEGVYDALPGLALSKPQLYRDLVGDSAHALHAYRIAPPGLLQQQ